MLRSDRGYILFEALLSVTILSVGIVALLSASQRSLRSVSMREHVYRPAYQVADKILSRYEMSALTGKPLPAAPATGRLEGMHYGARRSQWPGATDLEQVTVTVTWMDKGRPGSLALTSLLPVRRPDSDEETD